MAWLGVSFHSLISKEAKKGFQGARKKGTLQGAHDNDSSISSIAPHSKAERRGIWKKRLRRLQPLDPFHSVRVMSTSKKKTERKNDQNVSIAPRPIVY